mmetsp:Transcript_5738/g.14759  ORF Transcript_5738/g.14759 Transcript_5738/m.14759 type:complete len:347 (-) Transcript_5738:582-1622(-)
MLLLRRWLFDQPINPSHFSETRPVAPEREAAATDAKQCHAIRLRASQTCYTQPRILRSTATIRMRSAAAKNCLLATRSLTWTNVRINQLRKATSVVTILACLSDIFNPMSAPIFCKDSGPILERTSVALAALATVSPPPPAEASSLIDLKSSGVIFDIASAAAFIIFGSIFVPLSSAIFSKSSSDMPFIMSIDCLSMSGFSCIILAIWSALPASHSGRIGDGGMTGGTGAFTGSTLGASVISSMVTSSSATALAAETSAALLSTCSEVPALLFSLAFLSSTSSAAATASPLPLVSSSSSTRGFVLSLAFNASSALLNTVAMPSSPGEIAMAPRRSSTAGPCLAWRW